MRSSRGRSRGAVRYELCATDMAQATAWSEQKSTWMNSYADLVDVTADTRLWELTRVPRADVNSRLRHRVFKCSYLNRDNSDLANDSGAAGMVATALSAAALKTLSEYLWQFTAFNNADHVVLTSAAATAAAGQQAHAITLARLSRASVPGDCDRIDVRRWTHTLTDATGALGRSLETTQTIRARLTNGSVSLCP